MYEHFDRFYLDNNFFWLLCKDTSGKKIKNWDASLIKFGFVSTPRNIKFLLTPFNFLESVGLPESAITPPYFKIPDEINSEEYLEEVKLYLKNKAYDYFSQRPDLSVDNMIKKTLEQKEYGSEFGRDFFERTVAFDIKNKGFEIPIYHALAFDYVYKYNYPAKILDPIYETLLVDVIRGPSLGWNVSLARMLEYAWETKTKHIYLQAGKITEEACRKIKNARYCFKFNSDIVDTELTHFAVLGNFDNRKLNATACFTTDPPEKVKFRLWLYKKIVDFSSIEMTKMIPKQFLAPAIYGRRAGVVCICSKDTGEILEVIEVDKLSNTHIGECKL